MIPEKPIESTTFRPKARKITMIGRAASKVPAIRPDQSGEVPGCWAVN